MKIRSLLIPLLQIFGCLVSLWNEPVHSAATIIKCTGQIPDKTSCFIEPTSYKIDTYRVDICQRNPFPDTRSSADYAGAACMTLFDGKDYLDRREFARNSNYKITITASKNIKPGTYKYLAIVLKNGFKSSGKYTSGNTTWRTVGPDPNNLEITKGDPVEFSVKLSNWRGIDNRDNDYCDNNGGTSSRCESKYNGYEVTGIALGNDFIETYGSKVSYMFHMVKMPLPITIKEDSQGDFIITNKKRLEVYGNGIEVQSISIAPFIFQLTFISNKVQ